MILTTNFNILCTTCLFLLGGQHLKDLNNNPMMSEVLADTENMLLARGRMDLPLSLCFAVLRGDDSLLHQLLKRGLDPNESDNNGRTALVLDCISLLLILFHQLLKT